GQLIQVGTPYEIYNNPVNTYVARAVGSPPMNLIEGTVSGEGADAIGARLPISAAKAGTGEGRPLLFGVRPEDLHLQSGAPVSAHVQDIENHGVEKIITLQVDDKLLHATVSKQTNLQVNEDVRVTWDPEKVMFFDASSGLNLAHKAA